MCKLVQYRSVWTHTHRHTHRHTHTHTHTPTHTRTHTQVCRQTDKPTERHTHTQGQWDKAVGFSQMGKRERRMIKAEKEREERGGMETERDDLRWNMSVILICAVHLCAVSHRQERRVFRKRDRKTGSQKLILYNIKKKRCSELLMEIVKCCFQIVGIKKGWLYER